MRDTDEAKFVMACVLLFYGVKPGKYENAENNVGGVWRHRQCGVGVGGVVTNGGVS